jgi:hypothetical protein
MKLINKNRFAMALFVLSVSVPAMAQEKIIDKSGKQPKWVNSVEKGYIIEMGKGADAEEAKEKALGRVREAIIKSVAEQITSITVQNTLEKREGNQYQVSGDYASAILSRTAKMPFVKGISASRAEAFYWEKVRNKGTNAVWVNYHIKYPFSEAELGMIIADFEKDQKEKEMLILEICQLADNSNKLDEIMQKYRELQSLLPQLDDPLKGEAMICEAKIQSLLKSVSLVSLLSVPGKLAYVIISGDKRYHYNTKPLIRSNCASSFVFSVSGDSNLVSYAYNGCFENQANKITAEYRFEDISVKNDFPVDISQGKVEFSLTGGFVLKILDDDSLSARQSELGFSLSSKYSSAFVIRNVRLEFTGLNSLSFEDPGIRVSGKGIHDVRLAGASAFSKGQYLSRPGGLKLVSGTIGFTNSSTGEAGVYKFYNEKIEIHR